MTATPRGDSRLDTFERATHAPMVGVSLAVVPVYVGQALTTDWSNPVPDLLGLARLLIQVTMALDIAARTWLAPRRWEYLVGHKLDVVAVVLPPVRVLREVAALRSVLLRPGVVRFAGFAGVTITAGALLVYGSERGREDASIESVGDAFWWAIVTATTVGYGDNVPVTAEGRFAAVALMLLGIALFSVLTAHVAAYVAGGDRTVAAGSDLAVQVARLEASLAALDERLDRLGEPTQPAPPTPEEM